MAALALALSACSAPGDDTGVRGEENEIEGEDDDAEDDEDDRGSASKADAGARAGSNRGADAGGASTGSGNGQSSGDGATRRGADASADGSSGRADSGRGDASTAPDSDGDANDVVPSGEANLACAGGRTLLASDATGAGGTPVSGNAMVQFRPALSTHITELKTTLTVPAQPTLSSTLYAWPGLEPWPGGDNFNPVGQGVLQPVLTWGTSCGTYAPRRPTGWWISPQYVNPYTSDRAFYGCMGGKYIDVQAGAELEITMSLEGTVWRQLVVDRQTGQMTSFDMDLVGQAQNWALFEIEMPTQNRPVSDVVFSATTLTFADPDPMACQPSGRGATDYFSAPQVSADGTTCCVSRIVLRARGVPATTPNSP